MIRGLTVTVKATLSAVFFCSLALLSCFKNPTDTNPEDGSSNYYTVIFPESSSTLRIGESSTIMWTSHHNREASDYVQIDLFSEDSLIQQIITRTSDDGTYTWSYVSTPMGSGDNYRIRIGDDDDPEARYVFSETFTIESQYEGSIAVTSPDKDTTFSQGQSITIRWDTSGSPGSSVNIDLFCDSILAYQITSGTSNDGLYTWSVQSNMASSDLYRIRVSSYYDNAIYDYSHYFTIEGLDSDTFEIDNNRDEADTLDGRISQEHTLTAYDTDWVAVKLYEDTSYIFQLSGEARPRLYLYPGGSSTSTFNFYALSATNGYNGFNEYTPDSTAVYFIRITPYSTSTSYLGTYTLTVIPATEKGSVSISKPDSGTVWAAGSIYEIEWDQSAITGSSVNIRLYKGALFLMQLTSSTTNDGSQTMSVSGYLESGSDYRIRITDSYSAAIFGMSEPFTISGMTPDDYEDDDTRGTAGNIELGTPQEHSLYLNDTDWVEMELEEGTSYLIQTAGTARTYMYLYAEGSTATIKSSYASSTGSGYSGYILFEPDSTGHYFLRITPYSTSSSYMGDYTLFVNILDSCGTINVTSPDSGSVWASGSSYEITWDTVSFITTNVTISLYESGRSLLTISTGLTNTGKLTWTVPQTLPTSSEYQIRVQDYSMATVFGLSRKFTISGIPPDEYEDDDTRASAGSIDTGSVQQRSITYNDTDWVSIAMTKDNTYFIRTSGAVLRGYLYFGDSSSYSGYFTASTSSRSGSMSFICPRSGTYYLRLTPYSTSTSYHGEYTLSLYSGTDQGVVKVTQPAAGNTWASGSQYTINWDTSAIGYSLVEIHLWRGSTYLMDIISSTTNDGEYSWTIPTGFETAGNYRIRVESDLSTESSTIFGYSGEFTISGIASDEYEPDDSAKTAKLIPVDGTVQNRTVGRSNPDWIAFIASKDSLYCLALTSTTSKRFYLYTAQGTSYLLYQTGTAIKAFWTATVSDTVYLNVIESSNFGEYSISVTRHSSTDLLAITQPTGDAVWNSGSPYAVQWDFDSVLSGSTVRIYLTRSGTRLYTLSTATATLGTATITVPSGLMSGDDYAIEIQPTVTTLTFSSFSETFSISGIAVDEFEPDNTPAKAHTIAVDSTIQNRTIALSDTDWCSFTTKADRLYLLTIYGVTAGTMTLFNAAGTSQIEAQTTGSDSVASIFWFAQEAGTNMIRIAGREGAYTLSVKEYDSTGYQFTVDAPEADSAYAIGSTMTITWNGPLSSSEQVDLFLFNQEGVVQTIIANTTNDGSHAWVIPSSLSAGEGYYVRVISRTNSKIAGESGTFSLTE